MKTLDIIRALALASLAAAAASAQKPVYTVTMDGAQEVPPVATAGTGTATVTVTLATREVVVSGSYSGLTSNQTLAHIHLGAAGANGGPIVTLSGTGGTSGTISGSGILTAGQLTSLLACGTYINIHTVNNGGGEIRGQVTVLLNTTKPAELVGDPVLADCGGDTTRGPVVNSVTETLNVSLDCSNAGANGIWVIIVQQNTLETPVGSKFGDIWLSGAKLFQRSGVHTQNVVKFDNGGGLVVPNDLSLIGLSAGIQGLCSYSPKPARLSNALTQTIGGC